MVKASGQSLLVLFIFWGDFGQRDILRHSGWNGMFDPLERREFLSV